MILTFGSFYCKLSETHFTYWKSSDTSALLSFDAISNGFHLHLCKEKFKTWSTSIICRQTLKMLLLSCQQSAVTELFALAPMCLPQHQLQHQQSTSTKKVGWAFLSARVKEIKSPKYVLVSKFRGVLKKLPGPVTWVFCPNWFWHWKSRPTCVQGGPPHFPDITK